MKKLTLSVAALAVCGTVIASCHSSVSTAARPWTTPASPATLLWRGDNMAGAKSRLHAGDAQLREAYDALLRDADVALTAGPFTVMDKHRVPPSGDKHDYMSLAPYWWPDSTKPNGLPFIRRDGDVNPESRLDTDSPRFLRMSDAVETLVLAYYFSDDPRYAARAELLIRKWFLDPPTRMNPNLRFAQAVPGVTDGRGIGIIDTRNLSTIVDAVRILRGAPGWTPADEAGMVAWCRSFAQWLQTSTQGKEEQRQTNNHGTWYDAQLASLALFVGDTSLARRLIADAGPQRIAKQIAPDGKMPEELARTRPMHYTLFNIEPFARLAELGRNVGVDLWHYEAPNGASLRKAVMFIAPYLDPRATFPYKEITPADPEEFLKSLRQASEAYHDPALDAAILAMRSRRAREDRSLLLYLDAAVPSTNTANALDSLTDHVLQVAATRLRDAATRMDPRKGYPRSTKSDGRWDVTPANAWTSGFFAGELWQMYELTRDPSWRPLAQRWTAGLEPNKSRTDTHDLGFLIFDSFGLGYRLTGDAHDSAVVIDASRSLATRFSPAVGAIKSWDVEGATDARRTWKYPVIVDNLMNLEMLFWASAHGGDPAWRQIAERHALTSSKALVRDDGSTVHVALFDPTTGAQTGRVTWQGYADTSVWARGQAWAIYGFTGAYEATSNPALLLTAERVADWFAAHLAGDDVPYWDFSDPRIPNTERDASAAAIAASGLFELARAAGSADGPKYQVYAERILSAVCSKYVASSGDAILAHSVGGKPQGSEIDVGMVYADYYLLEAIARYRGVRPGVVAGQ